MEPRLITTHPIAESCTTANNDHSIASSARASSVGGRSCSHLQSKYVKHSRVRLIPQLRMSPDAGKRITDLSVRPHAADARRNGDILLPAHRIRHRGSVETGADIEAPLLFKCLVIER